MLFFKSQKNEPLRCHADSLCSYVGKCCTTFATNIENFEAMKCLPMEIDVSRLDEGKGLKETLISHRRRWHKRCYVLSNTTKVKRQQKDQSEDVGDSLLDRQQVNDSKVEATVCIFSATTLIIENAQCLYLRQCTV